MNFNTNKISSINVFLSKYLRRTLSTALLAASLMVLPYATANTQVVNGSIEFTKEYGLLTQEILQLLETTKQSLYVGIEQFRAGNRVGDVGYAIQNFNESKGYGVVRELVGHGLGKEMHEKPEMPNYGKRGTGKKFQEGMVVAIEPMINMGTPNINQLNDGWTILTRDNKPSAHFEHNIAIVNGKPKLLSTFDYIYDSLGIKSDEEIPFK